jgi:hypothetical protein
MGKNGRGGASTFLPIYVAQVSGWIDNISNPAFEFFCFYKVLAIVSFAFAFNFCRSFYHIRLHRGSKRVVGLESWERN